MNSIYILFLQIQKTISLYEIVIFIQFLSKEDLYKLLFNFFIWNHYFCLL